MGSTLKLGSTAGAGGGFTPLRVYGLKIYGDYNKAEGILLQNGIMVHGRAPGEEYDLS